MIRALLLVAIYGAVTAPVWADWSVCTPVPTGPIVSQKPVQPFVRKPDFAATSEAYDGMPPPELRGASPLAAQVIFGHVEQCGKPDIPGHPNAAFEACIRSNGTVYLPNPCDYGDREEFARLTCHELAHLFHQWPGDHPR